MEWRAEWKKGVAAVAVFLACFFLPVEWVRFEQAIGQALFLVRWYAREHVLLCLIPAFLIAGAITVFIRQGSVIRYLGAGASRVVSYGVASVAGAVLAVCSCTVLPLFAGIHRMGAGLGPAVTFLYAGPAINVLAIVLTARVLGIELGLARAVGAISMSVVIGVLMQRLFRKEERARAEIMAQVPEEVGATSRSLWQNAALMAAMAGILVFANWARSGDVRAVFLCCPSGLTTYTVEGRVTARDERSIRLVEANGQPHEIPVQQVRHLETVEGNGLQDAVHSVRWLLVGVLLVGLVIMVRRWYRRDEVSEWMGSAWGYAFQMLPLLLLGVLASGFLLGRPGHEGLIPARYIEMVVGMSPQPFIGLMGLSADGMVGLTVAAAWPLLTNLFAAVVGALMYFATLTEVPIIQGLMANGMAKGPALSLLLSGPAVSLPSMLVIASVLGVRQTAAYVGLVVLMSALCGMVFGWLP